MIHFLRKLQAFLASTVSSILLSRICIANSEFKNSSKSLNLKTFNFLHLCVKILQVNRLGPPSYCRKSVRSEIVVIVSPYYGVSYHWSTVPLSAALTNYIGRTSISCLDTANTVCHILKYS